MAKYIKQEMADMRGEGLTKAYYRMQTIRNIGMDEFIEIMTRRGGLTRGTAISALQTATIIINANKVGRAIILRNSNKFI